MLFVNFVEALIIASIFVNLPGNTSSFFKRGGLLFMMVLLNAFGSILEILALYAKRTIIEKHNSKQGYYAAINLMLIIFISRICPLSSFCRGFVFNDFGHAV
jgi:ABC-type multidrug transport system permease subunit